MKYKLAKFIDLVEDDLLEALFHQRLTQYEQDSGVPIQTMEAADLKRAFQHIVQQEKEHLAKVKTIHEFNVHLGAALGPLPREQCSSTYGFLERKAALFCFLHEVHRLEDEFRDLQEKRTGAKRKTIQKPEIAEERAKRLQTIKDRYLKAIARSIAQEYARRKRAKETANAHKSKAATAEELAIRDLLKDLDGDDAELLAQIA